MKRIFGFLFLLVTAACATPESQPYSPANHDAEVSGHMLITSDGTHLPYRQWLPAHKPDAVIVALHGFNDYSRGFDTPGQYLRKHGIALFAYDQRGFGSAPSHGVWAGEGNLVQDASGMVSAIHARYPNTPLYLMGESMGGAVAIDAVTHPGFPHVDGLILSAPAIWGGETLNPLFRASLWAFAHIDPKKMLTGEDLKILASDNIAMLRALGADPLVIKATRVDAIYGLVQLMDSGYANLPKVHIPTLLLYGAHDQVIPPEPIRKSMRKASAGVKIAYYPLGYHMLLRDLHGDVPLRDIASWVNDPNAPLPSGYDVSAAEFLKP